MKATRIILLFSALLLAGCFKDVSYKTSYILKPLAQQASGDIILPLEGAQAFAYSVDTVLWTVASYDEALNGIISSKRNLQEKMTTPAATSEPYEREGTEGWLKLSIANPSQMVVVVDPASRIYAYTQQELGENLPQLYVSVVFKPWKEGNAYKDGNWSFYNEFYTPPVFLDCTIRPTVQAEENGPEAEIASVKAYAYAADTTAWYIASYDDAAAGVITSKTDEKLKRSNPTFQAYKGEDGTYAMRVSDPTLMVVVVDRTNRLYAYTKKEVDLHAEAQTFPIVFRPWKQTWIDEEDGWRVVNPALDPDAEEPATPPTNQSTKR